MIEHTNRSTPYKTRRRLSTGTSLLLALLCWSIPVAAQAELAKGHLKQGEHVTGEMAGRAVHSYKVSIPENKYFHIVVEQLGSALIVALKDPTGAPIVQTHGQSGAYGPLYISAIANTAGDYELRVSAAEEWALAGHYQITLETVRSPGQSDQERIAAEKALAEGQGLLDEVSDKSAAVAEEPRRRALEKFKKAAEGFEVLKDRHGEVLSLYLIGYTYRRLPGQATEAKKIWLRALELAKDLARNDWRLEATIWNDLGLLYRNLYDQQQARSSLGNALRIFEDNRDRRGKASASNNLGLCYGDTGEGHKAIELFQIALEIRRLENDKENEINTINNLAGAYDSIGEFHQALAYAEMALRRWRELKRTNQIPTSLNNVAFAYERLGRWQQAIDHYHDALATGKANKGIEAATLLNLGDLYNKLNDFSRALESYEKSLTLQRELKNQVGEANVLAHIGTVHISLNNLTEALNYLNQARQITENNPALNSQDIQAYTLIGIGDVYRRQKKLAEALREFEGARKFAEAVSDRQQESDVLQKLGETYLAQGDRSKAQEHYAKALTLRRKLEDKLGAATTLYHIASLKLDSNEFDEAASASAESLALFEDLRGSILSKQLRTSYFETAQRCFELYIDVKLHLYRRDKDEKHVADALTANERAHARSLVDALAETSPVISQGVSPGLLQKKQMLAETLNSKAQNRQALLNAREGYQRAYEKDASPARSQTLTRTDHRLASLATDINRLLSEADDLETQLRKDSPGYATLTAPQPLTLNQVQNELLDDKTILLEYSLGDRRSFAFVVTPTSITPVELPKREEIEPVAQRLGAALIARNLPVTGVTPSQRQAQLAKAKTEYAAAASQLSRMVIDPVAPLLGEKRILVVADGALQLIPFTLLQLPVQSDQVARTSAATTPRLLIENHEIISLPSASVLAVQRRELQGRKPAPFAVAVLANPVFDLSDARLKTVRTTGAGRGQTGNQASEADNSSVDLSRGATNLPESLLRSFGDITPGWLPSTLDEAKAIEAVAPRGQTMLALDFKASRATATSAALTQYKIVHFATHGIADPEHPELSGIILSLVDENGVQQDGYLRLHEIYNLKLPAELVVLSACESGVGKQFKGEGLIALTRGFMYAGAASVVASLWKVQTTATSALMTEFYKEMFTNGKKPGAALRAAQLTISQQKRWREPYFWAGFVIQGEWR